MNIHNLSQEQASRIGWRNFWLLVLIITIGVTTINILSSLAESKLLLIFILSFLTLYEPKALWNTYRLITLFGIWITTLASAYYFDSPILFVGGIAAFGVCLIFIGSYFWYIKIQKSNDGYIKSIIKTEIETLE